jgi:hypothetical protein
MGSIPAIPDAQSVLSLLSHEQYNEASMPAPSYCFIRQLKALILTLLKIKYKPFGSTGPSILTIRKLKNKALKSIAAVLCMS